jgi:hypothetical protein
MCVREFLMAMRFELAHDDDKLKERVEFIQRTTDSTAIAEQFIEGREIYVGVMGNDRVTVLPAWEFAMTKKNDGAPLIASGRAKWDSPDDRIDGVRCEERSDNQAWTRPVSSNSRVAPKV